MVGQIATSPAAGRESASDAIPAAYLGGLLEALGRPMLIAEQDGRVVLINSQAEQLLKSTTKFKDGAGRLNLFADVLETDRQKIFQRVDSGEREIVVELNHFEMRSRAHIRWLPDAAWLLVELSTLDPVLPVDTATQRTVQELLQEREITYRNLLAAYLKLQDVNRQKTMFLASAVHELKTPLAVIKGYYDLLLAGSLGQLTDKQRDILKESKDSCERLVRLVSMFLNYSALESGKLALQLRENDLRDCLDELAKRWTEAFQRKGVRLEASIDPSIPAFRFDYQKVQQVAANLLDNALKHTPAGGSVTLRARPHFWERRAAVIAPTEERRRFRLPRPNSVEVSVRDTGPGIPAQYHQEIFEDFVRLDWNTSGMGLGLAIAKRLVQAHRGKIWLESEPHAGSQFTFLLPMEQS